MRVVPGDYVGVSAPIQLVAKTQWLDVTMDADGSVTLAAGPSDHEWFAQFEPIQNISATYPPTILLHGEADTDVPYDQSVLMQKELHRHGVVHELVSNPDCGHAFIYALNDPSVDKALHQIVAFLQKHTGHDR